MLAAVLALALAPALELVLEHELVSEPELVLGIRYFSVKELLLLPVNIFKMYLATEIKDSHYMT